MDAQPIVDEFKKVYEYNSKLQWEIITKDYQYHFDNPEGICAVLWNNFKIVAVFKLKNNG